MPRNQALWQCVLQELLGQPSQKEELVSLARRAVPGKPQKAGGLLTREQRKWLLFKHLPQVVWPKLSSAARAAYEERTGVTEPVLSTVVSSTAVMAEGATAAPSSASGLPPADAVLAATNTPPRPSQKQSCSEAHSSPLQPRALFTDSEARSSKRKPASDTWSGFTVVTKSRRVTSILENLSSVCASAEDRGVGCAV